MDGGRSNWFGASKWKHKRTNKKIELALLETVDIRPQLNAA